MIHLEEIDFSGHIVEYASRNIAWQGTFSSPTHSGQYGVLFREVVYLLHLHRLDWCLLSHKRYAVHRIQNLTRLMRKMGHETSNIIWTMRTL